MIAMHPDVVMVPMETHIYRLVYEPFIALPNRDLRQRLRSWKGILRRYGLKPLLFGIQPCHIWRGILQNHQILQRENAYGLHGLVRYSELKSLMKAVRTQPANDLTQAEDLIAALFDCFFQHQGGTENQTLLEKTPMHIRYVDRILRRFSDAKVIEAIRDGRDVCVSYNALAQQQRWARLGTQRAIQQWKQCIQWGEKYRAQAEFKARIHSVRYESLKANSQEGLREIFDFAGLACNQPKLDEIIQATDISQIHEKGEGHYVRKGAIGEWKTRLTEDERAICQNIAGEQLKQLGYD